MIHNVLVTCMPFHLKNLLTDFRGKLNVAPETAYNYTPNAITVVITYCRFQGLRSLWHWGPQSWF